MNRTSISALSRRQATQALMLVLAGFSVGCASTNPDTPTRSHSQGGERHTWSGRLGLNVDSEPPQSFSAGFALSGSPQTGELNLISPLGTMLAQMKWQPGSAILNQDGTDQRFDSLKALVAKTLGTSVPIPALFAWLRGEPAAVEGWQADLSGLDQGRLLAQRLQPLPTARLRLALDP